MDAGPDGEALGARVDAPLDATQARGLAALAAFDLTLVAQRVRHDGTVPHAWIDAAVLECRRYLGLRLLRPEPVTLFSAHVDAVWHALILHTRLYRELFEQASGGVVPHDPRQAHYPSPVADSEEPTALWHDFRRLYERYYGPLTPLWLRAAPQAAGTPVGAVPRDLERLSGDGTTERR